MKVDIADIARNNGKKGTLEIKQQPIAKIEAVQYFKQLNQLTEAMRKDVREQLMPLVKALESQYAVDGYADQLTQMVATLSLKYGNIASLQAKPAAEKMVNSVTSKNQKGFNASIKKAVGIDISSILADEGLIEYAKAQINKNEALIKSIPSKYFTDIETVVMNGVTEGLRWEEIAKQVGGIKDISSVNGKLQNRIKLIARNETSNVNAGLNKRRQEVLGVEKFKWQTAQDERVRDSHAKIDGNVYDWDNLPTVDGVKTSPGMPVQCRCVAIPVIEL